MENLIQKALGVAIEAHKGEVRKGDGKTPYVLHPIEVGIIISYYTDNPVPVAAAILHDTIEHGKLTTESIAKEFGNEVADLVTLLSEDNNNQDWAGRHVSVIQRLQGNNLALIIKTADALANMRDLFQTIKAEGTIAWDRFNAPKGQKLAYFRLIFDTSKTVLPTPLVEQYISALKDLEYVDLLPQVESGIGFVDKQSIK